MNSSMEKEIFDISIDDILPNRFQPRLSFDQNSLNELADSIRQHGIIQPLVVRKLGDKYEIIAGERRYKASVLVGLKKVPAIVMNLDDNQSAEIAIVENIQRKEMTPLEEAKSYKKLLDKGYLTQDQLATRMGKSQPAIANKLRLLNLGEEAQDALLHEKISERHARSLLAVKNPKDQVDVLNEILNKKLTVKQTDDLIKQRFGTTEDEEEGFPKINKLEVYSNPSPVIPNPYASNEPNPQLNLINRLNGVQMNNNDSNTIPKVENNAPSSIQNNPIQNNDIPIINPFANDNISTPVTPSPISFDEPAQNVDQPFTIDVNKIKEEAKDINQQAAPVDLGELLHPLERDVVPAANTSPEQEAPKNRFIFDFGDDDAKEVRNIPINEPVKTQQDTDILDISMPIEKTNDQPVVVNNTTSVASNVESAIDSIKNNIQTLKNNGIKVSTEEFDFEKLYQIIIKIDK